MPRRLFADVTPLRESAEFRWLWAGQSLSSVGSTMTVVAVSIQAYDLTGSSVAVGALGLANLFPTLLLGLFGGSIADAVDRRRLVLLTSTGLMAIGVLFAVQAFLHWDHLWLLYLLTATSAALAAVDGSARRTFPPRVLPVRLLPAAAALNQLSFQIAIIAAPLLAGVLIASLGLAAAYAVDALTFVAVLAGVRRLPPMPPVGGGSTFGLRSVAEGIRYATRHRLIGMIFLLDLNATALAMPTALFPALAATHFGGGAQTVSYLFAAIGVGGIVAATLSGPLGHLRHQGRAMLISVAVWGAAIGSAALTNHLWLALLLLATAGAADIVTTVFRATILQANTPDDLLGRLSSLDLVIGIGGPNLGNVRAGALGGLLGPIPALLLGGLTCVLGAGVLTASSRTFRRYDAKA
ncbi:MFS transporter [Kribbella sp. ALI-6-A]|uniref:MFS transporter n=1 Tax=Kribbella sp. ALI-6-A TaxID=1933817 RepID=UPI00097C4C58|nr:MFS transporter [Kribbella sp. ALI-6-A]ONI68485.1 MFS transporter [Kribbella sp. ALI-6-A]